MTNKIDLTGQTFGKWTVLRGAEEKPMKATNLAWVVRCECGTEKVVIGSALTRGRSKSCGCSIGRSPRFGKTGGTKHCMTGTSIHRTWIAMLERCRNKNHRTYHHYGGRGITVCEAWKKFENFFADMGDRPDGMTLDRKDNSLGYSKENCRWVDQAEQCRNKRNNRILTFQGQSKCLNDWAAHLGIARMTLSTRLSRGWDLEKALSTPTRGAKK